MSILTKVITSVFGTKSSKDLKLLEPIVTQINNYYASLSNISDEELKKQFNDIRNELKLNSILKIEA